MSVWHQREKEREGKEKEGGKVEKEGRREDGGAFTPENLAETKDRRMEERSLISSPYFFDYESHISVYEVRIFYETLIVPWLDSFFYLYDEVKSIVWKWSESKSDV